MERGRANSDSLLIWPISMQEFYFPCRSQPVSLLGLLHDISLLGWLRAFRAYRRKTSRTLSDIRRCKSGPDSAGFKALISHMKSRGPLLSINTLD